MIAGKLIEDQTKEGGTLSCMTALRSQAIKRLVDNGLIDRELFDSVEEERKLDGLQVMRTNVDESRLGRDDAVRTYKRLGKVGRTCSSACSPITSSGT
jgi:hypothetical protein